MAFTDVIVKGTYENPDDTPAVGSITFQLTAEMQNAGEIIAMTPISVYLDSTGTFQVTLAATDDPATLPLGVTYTVTQNFNGMARPKIWQLVVPKASPGSPPTLDLSTVAPALPATPAYPYALDSAVVHLAGTETITGAKTFSNGLTVSAGTALFVGLTYFKGGAPWWDFEAFGAIGNGAADDTTAVRNTYAAAAAVNGGTIRGRAGARYSITGSITLVPNVITLGASMGGQATTDGTVFQHDAGTNPLFLMTAATAPANMAFRDFKIQAGTGTGDAFQLGTVSNYVTAVEIANVYFRGIGGGGAGPGWCVNGINVLEVTIRECMTTHCAKGFFLGGNANVIRDCNLSNNGDGRIAVQLASSGNIIDGCVIEAWRPTAGNYAVVVGNATVGGSTVNRILNTWFEDNNGRAIQVFSTAGNWTTGFLCQGNEFVGDACIATNYTLSSTWIANSGLALAVGTSPDTNPCIHTVIGNSLNGGIGDGTTHNRDTLIDLGNRGSLYSFSIIGPVGPLFFSEINGVGGIYDISGTQAFVAFNAKSSHSWSNVPGQTGTVSGQIVFGNQVGDMNFSNWDLKGWRWITNAQGASNAQVASLDSTGKLTLAAGIKAVPGAFAAGDKYVVMAADGTFHVSALGPAS